MPDPERTGIGVRLIGLDPLVESMIRKAIDEASDLFETRAGDAGVVLVGIEGSALVPDAVAPLDAAVPRVLGVEAVEGMAHFFALRPQRSASRSVTPREIPDAIRSASRSHLMDGGG